MMPSEIDIIIGRNIRLRREAIGLGQADLCAKTSDGISTTQMSRYELGASPISAQRLVEVASILGCRVQDLFEGVVPAAEVMEKIPSLELATAKRLSELSHALYQELGFILKSVERT